MPVVDDDGEVIYASIDHCGACSSPCEPANAIFGECSRGRCQVQRCEPGFVDLNLRGDDGCEYVCTPEGEERCDVRDNDCDGRIDEDACAP